MVSYKAEKELASFRLNGLHREAMSELAKIAKTTRVIIYGNAIDCFLVEKNFLDSREFPLIEREWLSKRAKKENLSVEKAEKRGKEQITIQVSQKHKEKIKLLSEATDQSLSCWFRLAVDKYLFSLGITDCRLTEKVDKRELHEKVQKIKNPNIPVPPKKDTRSRVSVQELINKNKD